MAVYDKPPTSLGGSRVSAASRRLAQVMCHALGGVVLGGTNDI